MLNQQHWRESCRNSAGFCNQEGKDDWLIKGEFCWWHGQPQQLQYMIFIISFLMRMMMLGFEVEMSEYGQSKHQVTTDESLHDIVYSSVRIRYCQKLWEPGCSSYHINRSTLKVPPYLPTQLLWCSLQCCLHRWSYGVQTQQEKWAKCMFKPSWNISTPEATRFVFLFLMFNFVIPFKQILDLPLTKKKWQRQCVIGRLLFWEKCKENTSFWQLIPPLLQVLHLLPGH